MLRSYSSWALKTLQAKVIQNHQVSNINFKTRSRIINLGIRRTWRLYRQSRRGQAILDQIYRITSKVTDVFTGSWRSQTRGILLENLKQFNRTAEYQRLLNLSLVNTRSVRNKCDQVQLYLSNYDIDLCIITETWLKPSEEIFNEKELCPPGYDIISNPRKGDKAGGGIAILHKECLKVRINLDYNFDSCECFKYGIQLTENEGLKLCAIYRPRDSNVGMFIQDFTTMIEEPIMGKHELITAGDFNIHMQNKLNVDMILFDDILEAFNLINKVNFLTHIANHTLDLVIKQQGSSIIQSIERGKHLSDHHFINFKVLMETKEQLFKVINCRSLKKH